MKPQLVLIVAATMVLFGCGDINVSSDNVVDDASQLADSGGVSDTGTTGEDVELDTAPPLDEATPPVDTSDLGDTSDTRLSGECNFGDDALCDDADPCTKDACNTVGECTHSAATDVCKIGSTCFEDGDVAAINACKVCDIAQTKTEWSDLVCASDDEACTSDACDSDTGCDYAPASGPCDDGVVCTTDDHCDAGKCVAAPCECASDSECVGTLSPSVCEAEVCTDGKCALAPDEALAGSSCDDGDACTLDDVCAEGVCTGTALECSANDFPCLIGECVGGECTVVILEVGASCTPLDNCVTDATCTTGGNCAGTWDASCACSTDADCDDGLDCTDEACSDSACESVTTDGCKLFDQCAPAGLASPLDPCLVCDPDQSTSSLSPNLCDDDDVCTADTCGADGCLNDPITTDPCECAADEHCGDGNACTDDACVNFQCESTNNDANLCSVGDDSGTCVGGACVADCNCTTNADCSGTSNGCQLEECTECHCTLVPDPTQSGVGCDDDEVCTMNDQCDAAGSCAGTAYVCEPLSCQTATCDGNGGCGFETDPNFCEIDGMCYALDDNNPLNFCQNCSPSQSDSEWTNRTGVACDADNTGCTQDDACSAMGACTPGPQAECSDTLACTMDACKTVGDSGFECIFPLVANRCLIDGACAEAGALNPNNPCQACRPDLSPSGYSAVDNGVSCDADSQACTPNDTCVEGACTADSILACDNKLPCTNDTYAKINGAAECQHQLMAGCLIGGACVSSNISDPLNSCQVCSPGTNTEEWSSVTDGQSCNADGDGCTSNDSCQGGSCTEGSAESCDDGKPCTGDLCVSTGDNSFTCENTAGGACVIGGTCVSVGAPEPGNDCRTCNPSISTDSWTSKDDGAYCNFDSNGCTKGDSCQAGTCEAGGPAPCGDGLACTDDTCFSAGDSAHGCVNPVAEGCVIGGACIASGAKEPGNPCRECNPSMATGGWSPVSNGTSCNADSNGCTVDDACQVGSCVAGSAPSCADTLVCTSNDCTSTGNNTHSCSNSIVSGCVIAGACVTAGTSEPGNSCRSCDPSKSPSGWSAVGNGISCNADSDGCTQNDSCQLGTCTIGSTETCSDGKGCTADMCTSTGINGFSCSNPVTSGCLIGGSCISSGAADPGESCRKCTPGNSTTAYTAVSNGTLCNADSDGCTHNDACSGGTCQAGSAPNCSDLLSCTSDICISTGSNSNSCSNNVTSGCLISGTCYVSGDTSALSDCKFCNPGSSTSSFSNASSGTPCDDGVSCTESVCGSIGKCTQGTVASDKCYISGGCYNTNQINPQDECEWCRPSTSQTNWSENPFCEECFGNQFCNSSSDCGSTGFCSNNQCVCF